MSGMVFCGSGLELTPSTTASLGSGKTARVRYAGGSARDSRERVIGGQKSCCVVPGHFLADNAPERVFPLQGFPLDVFSQRRIDQRLVADLAAGPIGNRTEIVDQVFIQPDGDPHLSGL